MTNDSSAKLATDQLQPVTFPVLKGFIMAGNDQEIIWGFELCGIRWMQISNKIY